MTSCANTIRNTHKKISWESYASGVDGKLTHVPTAGPDYTTLKSIDDATQPLTYSV